MKLLLAFDNAHDIYLGCERNSAASEENKNIRLNSFFFARFISSRPRSMFFFLLGGGVRHNSSHRHHN